MLRCGVSSVVSACIFALCKLLLFYNYVCRVDLLAFTVGVASGLNAAGDGDLRSPDAGISLQILPGGRKQRIR